MTERFRDHLRLVDQPGADRPRIDLDQPDDVRVPGLDKLGDALQDAEMLRR